MPQLDQRHWLLGSRLQQMGFLLQQRFSQPVKGREKASRESPSREAACEAALLGSAHQFQCPINFRPTPDPPLEPQASWRVATQRPQAVHF